MSLVFAVVISCVMFGPNLQTPDPGPTLPDSATNDQTHVEDAQPNPLLEQADEEAKVTYFQSHVAFEYRYDKFDDNSHGDSIRLDWLQSFGPSNRLAAGIELPIIYESGPEAAGIGDITLEIRGMLGKTGNFQHAAGFEITVPSGSQTLIDEGHIVDGQTVLGVLWGCTGKLTNRTELSFELRYNKAVHNRGSDPKRNYLAPELIITQKLARHVAGYVEWDQYYEYSKSLYVPMLKPGVEIAMDREEKWSISPYVVFPLNRNARIEETKLGAGVVLSYSF